MRLYEVNVQYMNLDPKDWGTYAEVEKVIGEANAIWLATECRKAINFSYAYVIDAYTGEVIWESGD